MSIFWRCYYHFIWTTKYRQPCITPQHEKIIFSVITEKTNAFDSELLAINGIADHIHVAVSLNPKISISEWMKHAKGTSSHAVNTLLMPETPFRWQKGYGVLTFGKTNLELVVGYVENQKTHHAQGTLESYMETTTPE